MSRVLISGSHNVYVGEIPDSVREPMSFGELMIELQLGKRGALVIGVRTPDGEEIINPSRAQIVDPSSRLIYLSEKPLLEPPS